MIYTIEISNQEFENIAAGKQLFIRGNYGPNYTAGDYIGLNEYTYKEDERFGTGRCCMVIISHVGDYPNDRILSIKPCAIAPCDDRIHRDHSVYKAPTYGGDNNG